MRLGGNYIAVEGIGFIPICPYSFIKRVDNLENSYHVYHIVYAR
jgi:hypothetical protein